MLANLPLAELVDLNSEVDIITTDASGNWGGYGLTFPGRGLCAAGAVMPQFELLSAIVEGRPRAAANLGGPLIAEAEMMAVMTAIGELISLRQTQRRNHPPPSGSPPKTTLVLVYTDNSVVRAILESGGLHKPDIGIFGGVAWGMGSARNVRNTRRMGGV